MPTAGTPVIGEVLKVSVEDPLTPGTFFDVTNMNAFDSQSSRAVRKERVFNKTQPLRSPSTVRDQSCTVGGLVSIADSGQGVLNAAELAGTTVKIKILVDGTNGFTVVAYVTSYKFGAKPDGSFESISYDLEYAADPVAVGTGWTAL